MSPRLIAVQTLAALLVILLLGAASLWAGEPFLTVSLGPSLLMQTLSPEQKAASAWNTAAGQLLGLGAGFVAVYVVGAVGAPAFMGHSPLLAIRLAAALLAYLLLIPSAELLNATHPPAGSTALLIALRFEPATVHTAWMMVIGIALVTLFGEAARVVVLRAKA